jgi:type IV secretion system protein VirB6
VAVMEPWLADVLNRRNLGYATPTAPTELLALVLAFAIAAAGLLFILGKIAFQNSWVVRVPSFAHAITPSPFRQASLTPAGHGVEIPVHSRAVAISEVVALQMRREEAGAAGMDRIRRIGMQPSSPSLHEPAGPIARYAEPLGSGYRRTSRRDTGSQRTREDR